MLKLLFIQSLGMMEISVLLVIVLVLFGGRKIPQLAKDLGSGIREFKKSLSSTDKELAENTEYEDDEEEEQKPVRRKKKARRKTKS